MEYGVVYTMYSMFFLIMLVVTFFSKRRNKTIRVKLYTILLIFAFLFSLFEILTIYTKKIFMMQDMLTIICWKLRIVCIILFFAGYFIYCDILFEKREYNSFREIFKIRKHKIVMILAIILSIFVTVVLKQRAIYIENFEYVSGATAFVLCTVAVLIALYTIIKAWPNRSKENNIFSTYIIIFIEIAILFPIQIFKSTISYMPLAVCIVVFLIYFNIENPDIELSSILKKMQNEINKLGNSKIDFLFTLSKELQEPVMKIKNISDNLNNKINYASNEFKENISLINSEGNILLDSINNMLDISTTGKEKNKEYKLSDIIDKIETNIKNKIGIKQIKFEIEISNNVYSKFYGDEAKLQKILITLLNNAVKYTEKGKIKFTILATNNKDIQNLTFKILDTGIGIKEEKQKDLLNEENKDNVMLLQIKKYIEELSGTINFESVYLGGTTFIVNIPFKISGNKTFKEELDELNIETSNQILECSAYKVLIVDDNPLELKVTKRILERYKFQITTTTSPKECINKFKSDEKYDILFIDHKMSEMDGVEVMKVIKYLDIEEQPRIIMLTANAMPGIKEQYLQEGFDDYISKPIDINELDKIIKRFYKARNKNI